MESLQISNVKRKISQLQNSRNREQFAIQPISLCHIFEKPEHKHNLVTKSGRPSSEAILLPRLIEVRMNNKVSKKHKAIHRKFISECKSSFFFANKSVTHPKTHLSFDGVRTKIHTNQVPVQSHSDALRSVKMVLTA